MRSDGWEGTRVLIPTPSSVITQLLNHWTYPASSKILTYPKVHQLPLLGYLQSLHSHVQRSSYTLQRLVLSAIQETNISQARFPVPFFGTWSVARRTKIFTRFSISVRANMYVRTLLFWCKRVYKRRVAWSEFCCSHNAVYKLLKLIWKAWGVGEDKAVLSGREKQTASNVTVQSVWLAFQTFLPIWSQLNEVSLHGVTR